ncbi:hypothetical protein CSOJ01_12932 [Colletotrichum sojae]|uniref:Uncharacterized protein n=1 Tax=Colletotrichum sojae TaxID=2175907 RepID=A0A8H6ITZ7_9PEZI|nr:hypothetical protein CSOJ01_12932 [Colletotrichum sojae]
MDSPHLTPEEEEDINYLYGPLLSHEDLAAPPDPSTIPRVPSPTASEIAAYALSSFEAHVYSSRDTIVTRVLSVDAHDPTTTLTPAHSAFQEVPMVLKEHTSYEKLKAYRKAALVFRDAFISLPFDLPLVPCQYSIFDERDPLSVGPVDHVPIAAGMEGAILVQHIPHVFGAEVDNHSHNPREAYSRHRPPSHLQVHYMGDTQVLLHPKAWLGMNRPRQPYPSIPAARVGYFEQPLYLDEVLHRFGEPATRRLARQMGAALAVIHYELLLDASEVRFRLAQEKKGFGRPPSLWACGLDEMKHREPVGDGRGVEGILAERVWANEPFFPRPDIRPAWVFDAFRDRYVEVGEHIMNQKELVEEPGEVKRPDLSLLSYMLGRPVISNN